MTYHECGWCITSRHKVCHFPAWCDCRKATQQGDWGASCETMEQTENVPATVRPARGLGRLPAKGESTLTIILPASTPHNKGF